MPRSVTATSQCFETMAFCSWQPMAMRLARAAIAPVCLRSYPKGFLEEEKKRLCFSHSGREVHVAKGSSILPMPRTSMWASSAGSVTETHTHALIVVPAKFLLVQRKKGTRRHEATKASFIPSFVRFFSRIVSSPFRRMFRNILPKSSAFILVG